MKGQYGRAAVSGLGALGGAAALTRHPLLMPIGMGIAAGAPYLNEYLDTLAEKHPGLHLADGGSVEDQNQGAYVGYPQINRSRQVGSGSGFLDAALGAPQQNPSVLDPKNASYLKGYEAGEPYGIAGNVLPFLGGPTKSVGKAALRELGPKGADIMEQYLTKIGGIAHMMPTDTKIMRASEALSPHEGKYLNLTQSDRMRSTGGDLGGPGFSKFQLENPDYAGAAWGVAGKPTASGIVNVNKRYPEGQALWTPMIGSETQHHSNQHVYDALTQEFNRQASMGNLPKELQARINARMTNAPTTKGMFPEGFDIGNPEHLAQYGDTFNRRGEVSKVLSGEGVGGTKGRVIDYPGIMQEMTDPMTIGAPTHSIGTRLFNLTGEVEHRPDLHSAFPYILKGEDKGVAFSPVPKELGIPDFINQFKEFKGREPGYYDLTRTTPSQQITDKYLKSLDKAGHKKGGKIKKAKK